MKPAKMAAIAMGVCGALIMLDIGRSYVLTGAAFVCLALTILLKDGAQAP